MSDLDELNKQITEIRQAYLQHFGKPIPQRIIGWWDPLHIEEYPDELRDGVKAMRKDVQHAIATNTPIAEIDEETWNTIVF